MSIGEAIRRYRVSNSLTQREFASQLAMDRSVLARIERGKRDLDASYDTIVSGLNWRIALEIADERTDGYISNILEHLPNLDLHPAALKDLLLKELTELEAALEELVMAKHIDPKKRRQSAERVWHEIRDVMEKAAVLQGVLEEEFGLERKSLILKHQQQLKRGER
ncbi:helix-turn-helix domain-containing protein [Paenibacillus rigui]|uniref:Transcriptional regulator n=1 Tax=Paenibacillus rigui TaxID=554312 RepID=A0A229UMI0_9BACL|nr:helix-turn-helix transcriptional regulator [Paenibacillus rigui]OXM84583.1 transcriptional regulator [Paenibacillus rigui]